MNSINEKKFLLVENGKETGPFTESQLQERIKYKEIFSATVCIPKSLFGIPGPLSSFFKDTTPEPKAPLSTNTIDKQKEKKMHCRNCSKEIDAKAAVCVGCGVPPRAEKKFCYNCGTATTANQAMCIDCGVALAPIPLPGQKSKSTATLLGIFLGFIGAHKFYMGSWGWGLVYLLTCWLWIPGLVAIVEWIRYILMTDDEFADKAAAFEGKGPFDFFW